MRDTFYLLGAGLLAGVLSGIFGIGGGLVLIPFLIFVMGYSQYTANGTSLVALLGPVGLLGVIAYYNSGQITATHIRAGLIIAIGLFLGSYFGSRIALAMPELILRRTFCLFLLFTATRLWFK